MEKLKKPGSYRFSADCTSWPDTLDELNAIIDSSIEISRTTFMQRVHRGDLKKLEKHLGYEIHWNKGMTMASDWHVSYHRGRKLNGNYVYFFKHSCIEFIFE